MSNMTLGSLFDGSGGFPLGGMLAGITPVWASEIEPFPIRVTTKRLPFMKHYGNVSKMDGGKVEPVDIITFGSPCQDMSVAGKRAGLEGSRSNLFYEAVRIIKEMRKATGGEYPKWACWENVPGAFSSSGGEDFRCVLESLCGVIDESVSIPKPKKWANAGEILGDGYSLAWRVLDAQYWGVPQRRKRIYLVVDFRGDRAPKVLFEPESLRGDTAESDRARKEAPAIAGENTQYADYAQCVRLPECLGGNRIAERSTNRRAVAVHQNQSGEVRAGSVANTLATNGNASGRNAPLIAQVYDTRGNGDGATVGTITGDHNNRVTDYTAIAVLPFDTTQITSPINRSQPKYGVSFTLTEADRHAVAYHVDAGEPECEEYAVRRLTPTECARLQGFPDWWCSALGTDEPSEEDIAFWRDVFETHRTVTGSASKPKTDAQLVKWLKNPHTDSAEYKLWGNGVALPCVYFVLSGIVYFNRMEQEVR